MLTGHALVQCWASRVASSTLLAELPKTEAQAAFIADRHAQVGIDHLLPFEKFDAVERFFEKTMNKPED